MAKSKLSYKVSKVDKVAVKGILSDDCTTVTYEDEDGVEQVISIVDLLAPMAAQAIDFSVSTKVEDELGLPVE